MDQIIKLVVDKTGIPADTAKVAVETVIAFLKEKLPAPIASQIDSVLSGDVGGGLLKGLGGSLGLR